MYTGGNILHHSLRYCGGCQYYNLWLSRVDGMGIQFVCQHSLIFALLQSLWTTGILQTSQTAWGQGEHNGLVT